MDFCFMYLFALASEQLTQRGKYIENFCRENMSLGYSSAVSRVHLPSGLTQDTDKGIGKEVAMLVGCVALVHSTAADLGISKYDGVSSHLSAGVGRRTCKTESAPAAKIHQRTSLCIPLPADQARRGYSLQRHGSVGLSSDRQVLYVL